MKKRTGNNQTNADKNGRHAERSRSMVVKSIPIRKNNKIYRVGEEFPYTEKDKSLLWNLIEKPAAKKKPVPSVGAAPRKEK